MNPLVKYQAYELVNLDDRTVLHAPAPGLAVHLAEDVDGLVEEMTNVLSGLVAYVDDVEAPLASAFEAEYDVPPELVRAKALLLTLKGQP